MLKTSKLLKIVGASFLSVGAFSVVGISISHSVNAPAEQTKAEDYYASISNSLTGSSLLNALHELNSSKRSKTIGYSSLRNYFKYTEVYDGIQSGKMVGFYNNDLITNEWDDQETWNHEHIWPNSRGGGSNNKGGLTSPFIDADIHMTRPAAQSVNSTRGNLMYAASGAYDPGQYVEEYRGVAARIIFYSAIADTRLSLTDNINDATSNSTMGKLSDLLKWNLQYAPSTSSTANIALRVEQNRNETIYSRSDLQGNRNPFIDHPEYACRIWGDTNDATKAVCGSSGGGESGGDSEDSSYEQLTSISNIDGTAKYVLGIDNTGFHYSGTSSWGLVALPSSQTPLYYTLTKASNGNSFTAKTTINSTDYYLQVPTSNTFSMATSTGTNTDLIIGTTQVSETNYAVANKNSTARHLRINGTNGLRSYAGTTGSMAYFYKVVEESGGGTTDPVLTSISLNTDSVTKTFTVGDTFSYSGLVVTAHYDGASDATVTPTSVSSPDMTTSGEKTITVSYTEGDVTKSATYKITVNESSGGGETTTSTYTANGDYVKVTSSSDLTDGEYLIVYEDGGVAFNGGLTTLDAVSNTINVTISNSTIAASSSVDAATFTYNDSEGTLKSKSGYYIGQTANDNGLKSNTSTTYSNSITISSGDANIVSSNAYMRYNNNSGQYRFRYFKSSSYTNQKAIQLYKKTISWGSTFLTTVTCNGGTTAPNTTKWSDMQTAYNSMVTTEKNKVKAASANESGTDLQKAIARYVFIVNKYTNRTNYPDYLSKASSSNRINPLSMNDSSTLLVVIATTTCLIGMTFIALSIKKRKEK